MIRESSKALPIKIPRNLYQFNRDLDGLVCSPLMHIGEGDIRSITNWSFGRCDSGGEQSLGMENMISRFRLVLVSPQSKITPGECLGGE